MTSATRDARQMDFRPASDAAAIAVSAQVMLDARQLGLVAAAIRARLSTGTGNTWGLYLESPFLQIAALTAMQCLGRKAVLLPHVQPQSLRAARAQHDGLLTDVPVGVEDVVQLPALEQLTAEGEALEALCCDWLHPIGFLTSGSSGEPTCSWKHPEQIVDEVSMLEAAFGSGIGRERIIHGTTSHQHLYGFTFRVMWPFLTGRPFADTQIRIPSEVSAAIETHQQIVLISSPAFLARARQILDFEQLSASALIAFSSGGPLDGDTAMHFNATPDVSLVEIYGSTETGALAHRSRVDDPLTPWQPLPGVEIDIVEGFLTVHARHAHCNRRVKTADRAEAVPGGGFILKGRADQIVKVADKRVSLSELERLLHARPEVAEARVLQLEDGRLGGVVSPTDSGWEQVRRLGKSRFVSALRDHLSQHVDRVTTPRRWRLTKTIPRNTQGKVELAALRTLFAHDLDRKLEWHTLKSDANTWIASTTVPADLPELDGHFPGEPVVPGVAQLSWAATAAKRQFGLQHLSGAMENVKFRKPILPGCTVRLTLRLATNARRVDFELSDDNQVYSSGRFLLEGCEFRPA